LREGPKNREKGKKEGREKNPGQIFLGNEGRNHSWDYNNGVRVKRVEGERRKRRGKEGDRKKGKKKKGKRKHKREKGRRMDGSSKKIGSL